MDIDKQIDDEIFRSKEKRMADMIAESARREKAVMDERVKMRDDIAIRVLIAMIETTPSTIEHAASKVVIDRAPGMARTAYHFADAMLAARAGERKASPEEIVKALQTPIRPDDVAQEIRGWRWPDGFNLGVRVQYNSGIKEASRGVIANGRVPERGLVIVRWDNGPETWEKISSLRIIGDEK